MNILEAKKKIESIYTKFVAKSCAPFEDGYVFVLERKDGSKPLVSPLYISPEGKISLCTPMTFDYDKLLKAMELKIDF